MARGNLGHNRGYQVRTWEVGVLPRLYPREGTLARSQVGHLLPRGGIRQRNAEGNDSCGRSGDMRRSRCAWPRRSVTTTPPSELHLFPKHRLSCSLKSQHFGARWRASTLTLGTLGTQELFQESSRTVWGNFVGHFGELWESGGTVEEIREPGLTLSGVV